MGIKTVQRSLEEFVKKNDIAPWYQGMSPYQEKAVRGLKEDLRDDFEQGSSYRVEKCLMRIGLSPLISKKKIRTMVHLSRGNDLAFCFFLLEGYYKTNHKESAYSTNEQILMTAISKLDTMATLKELDRILPPGHPSKKQPVALKRNSNPKPKELKPQLMKPKTTPQSNKLPYFQRQPRPKTRKTNIVCKQKNFTVGFSFWPVNGPANYSHSMERPWFSDYKLNPAARVVKNTVDDAVNKFFRKKPEVRRVTGWEKEIEPFEEGKENIVCAYHKFLQAEAELLKDELKVIARDRCLELIDVTFVSNKRRRERILSQLEHDVQQYMEKYSNLMKMDHTPLTTLSKADCIICKAIVSTPEPNKSIKTLIGDCDYVGHTEVLKTYKGKRLTGGGLRVENIDFLNDTEPCLRAKLSDTCLMPEGDQLTAQGKILRISLPPQGKRKSNEVDVKLMGKLTKKMYFKLPEHHKPYQFKFKRVFKSPRQEVNDVEKYINQCFIRALKKPEEEDLEKLESPEEEPAGEPEKISICKLKFTDSNGTSQCTSDHSQYSHIDEKAEIVDAVVRCAKQMWKQKASIKKAQMEFEEEKKRLIEQENTRDRTILNYGITYFDADDDELMDRMLKDGMDELKKNPRYVLASLPSSHKLPILREWIKRRYGKVYNMADIKESLRESHKIFETVIFLQMNPPPVDFKDMPDGYETFAAFNATMKKANEVKAEYFEKLNHILMQQLNPTWYAMGNYLNTSGPPKKTFYAYMPANYRDILRFRLWNGEHRNYRQLRDMLRARKEKQEA